MAPAMHCAEWCALDFAVARRRALSQPGGEDTRWTLYRSADERAATAVTAEAAEIADWVAMVDDVVSCSDLVADLHSDSCTHWQESIACERYSKRHCFLCRNGQDVWAGGRFKRKQTPYATGPVLEWCPKESSQIALHRLAQRRTTDSTRGRGRFRVPSRRRSCGCRRQMC